MSKESEAYVKSFIKNYPELTRNMNRGLGDFDTAERIIELAFLCGYNKCLKNHSNGRKYE